MLPLFVVLLAFFLVPTLDVIRLSFTNASLAKPSYDYTTKSYLKVIRDSAFPEIMSVTLIFVSISVVFQFLLGFVIAYCVDKGEKYRLRGTVAVRTISLVSWAIPGVAIGIIWKIMYAENAGGILNYLLSLLGFGQVAFLSDPNTAIFSVCLANIWRGTAQSMILLYSGLKTVPADVLEAADVDGASNWRKIVSVTIPSMKSVITVNILLNIINTFNTFDMIMPLTGGGPGAQHRSAGAGRLPHHLPATGYGQGLRHGGHPVVHQCVFLADLHSGRKGGGLAYVHEGHEANGQTAAVYHLHHRSRLFPVPHFVDAVHVP